MKNYEWLNLKISGKLNVSNLILNKLRMELKSVGYSHHQIRKSGGLFSNYANLYYGVIRL